MKTGDSLNLNLLPSQAKFQAARLKLKETLKHYMVLAIVFWVVILIVVYVVFFGSGIVLKVEGKKYQQALTSYQSLSEDIILNQLLKFRAKILGQVLKERFEYSKAFERVNSLFADKAKVSKFELKEKRLFNVQVSAKDKEAVDFVEGVVVAANDSKIDGIKGINLKTVNYVKGSDWLMAMEVLLP